MVLKDVKTKKEILRIRETRGMYPFHTWKPSASAKSATAIKTLTVMEAHACLGQIVPDAVQKLVHNGVAEGLNVNLDAPNEDCVACIFG